MRRIVITGASGFVGQQITQEFRAKGVGILLVGREPEALKRLFPDEDCVGYDQIATAAAGCDLLLHLAVMNNDVEADVATFFAVNVDLLRRTALAARDAGIPIFVNLASLHVISGNRTDPYTLSKKAGEGVLAEIDGIEIVSLRSPAIYGSSFKGNLAILERLPKIMRIPALRVLSALRPTVGVDVIADKVLALASPPEQEIYLSDPPRRRIVYCAVTRVLDILAALAIFILLSWLMILCWIGVRATSKGPGLFVQTRIGQHGKPFQCYKFRTMQVGTPQVGTHEVTDSSVTNIGRWLRKTKIDELPQAWNILKNEMSLVGPRPCLPKQTALVDARERCGVLEIKGGITGLAQIQGIDMSDSELLAKKDAEYLMIQSVPLYFSIIVKTLIGRGQGDKVRAGK